MENKIVELFAYIGVNQKTNEEGIALLGNGIKEFPAVFCIKEAAIRAYPKFSFALKKAGQDFKILRFVFEEDVTEEIKANFKII